MQFSESWLRSLCQPNLNSDELAETLTMAGLEVEERQAAALPFEGVVVARLVRVQPHPNADRLRVCLVDAGPSQRVEPSDDNPEGYLQIVCGAPNAREGLLAPLALVGAQLPPAPDGSPGISIKSGKLRGIASQGMLCSAVELGINEESNGLLELDEQHVAGTDLRQALNLDDTLLTLKLTPNLGHALSIAGVARELSAITGATLNRWQDAVTPVPVTLTDELPIDVQAPDLCARFSRRIVRGIRPGVVTPQWMQDRLRRSGQRPVSLLVDISNYVMFETGQPTHIFDLAKVEQSAERGLTVRWAQAGETLELLNGQTITLQPHFGVIAGVHGPESLAGIMGGQATSVSDTTTDIVIEAAFWWPEAIASRGRELGFSSEASHRYERGVDPQLTLAAIERITALITELCGGQCGPISDWCPAPNALPFQRPAVRLRVARAARIIGSPISLEQCTHVMQRLGFAFEQEGQGEAAVLVVTPPSHRFDIAIEEDLIEEVIRLLGYETLLEQPVYGPLQVHIPAENKRSLHTLRLRMAAQGYQETINFSFVESRWETDLAGNANPITVLNPIAAPLAVMRSSLMGSLLQVLERNQARRNTAVRIFEIGRVFKRQDSIQSDLRHVAGIDQPMRLGGLSWGSAQPLQWHTRDQSADFYHVKADIEALLAPLQLRWRAPDADHAAHPALHPGRSAWIDIAQPSTNGETIWQTVGCMGELHPQWCQAYAIQGHPFVFELDAELAQRSLLVQSQSPARQIGVWRDLALKVPQGLNHDTLQQALQADPQALVRSATLFDIYRSAELQGTSMAWRLHLLDNDQTLTEDRIETCIAAALQRAQELGAALRES